MKKEIYIEKKVPCAFYPETGCNVDHCKKCTFFSGMDETSVDCLRAEVPEFSCHVTSFIKNGYLYKVRKYDEEKDGPLEDEDYYCEKCCFNKTLQNGIDACLLRCGTTDTMFICYDDEIWEKTKID